MTLEKYLPKETVIEHKNGAKELVATQDVIEHHLLLEDTSHKSTVKETKKDARQQSKIICQWQEPCKDKEDQFCNFRGKWCSQQARVRE